MVILALNAGSIGVAADNNITWERYDESADLAALAAHQNESMHYQLLLSKVLDKNTLWEPFVQELEAFSHEYYESLKPLILDKPISQIQRVVAEGSLSYETLATFYIYRIREIETDNTRYINAVITLNPNVLTRARMLDEQRRQGREIAPDSIFGIPVLLKDNVGASGMATTAGAVALQHNFTSNAFITDRLIKNGAIILGKANLSEWAYFFCEDCPSGYSAMGGQTLNPYGRFDFGTGGSSSGSGAGTAANFATVAVGSETSGSILSPASANSLVGLKPTTGSLSRSGVVPISSTLDTTGPITRNIADAVILFNAMAGFDENDMAMPLLSADLSLIYRTVDLNGKRLGALENFADNEFYQEALEMLSENEASIVDVIMNYERNEGFSDLLGSEMVRDLALYLEAYSAKEVEIDSIASLRKFNEMDLDLRAPYGQELVDMMDELALAPADVESLRDELQSNAKGALEYLFTEFELDVLLSINNRHANIAALANYPALTIPLGYEASGRPVGLTLIAPSFQEQALIDIGVRVEQLTQARRIPTPYQ
ncbi:MAG: amidase [Gammaproteobacteria bacterium]|nr:amidase [Gammaproteobacteria bacterium]